MKLISWNVNGIRAATRGGFLKWLEQEDADVVCLQETKATAAQLEPAVRSPLKYRTVWHSAQKAGYSGVAILSKHDPLEIREGMGVEDIDAEGRVLIFEYPNFVLINAYFPNSQREHARLPYKLAFCKEMLKLCNKYKAKGKNIVLCGDYNIAHREIDLKNPKSNTKNAGFLPEERAWMDQFLKAGYSDVFRDQHPEPGHYTWWSYRPGVREKNIGWRIDYHCVNSEFADRVKRTEIHPHVMGSDHCPILLEVKK
ncbi:MAG: exodeoxyribonuclease III [Bacteriovoracia bacterium]